MFTYAHGNGGWSVDVLVLAHANGILSTNSPWEERKVAAHVGSSSGPECGTMGAGFWFMGRGSLEYGGVGWGGLVWVGASWSAS